MPSQKTTPQLQNALLRCIRNDDLAAPAFELVNEGLNLWVLELSVFNEPNLQLADELQIIEEHLMEQREFLRKLSVDSSD